MKTRLLVFPHQLFDRHPGLDEQPDEVLLVEDSLFFGDDYYPMRFHKQKLWLHRASMQRHARLLESRGNKVKYVDYQRGRRIGDVLNRLKGKSRYIVCDPGDFILNRRLRKFSSDRQVEVEWLRNPLFLNDPTQNTEYRSGKKRWFMADFYKAQRRRLGILMDGDEPRGGKWSFDADNRKKIPKNRLGTWPEIPVVAMDGIDREARQYVLERFPDNPGSIDRLYLPTSCQTAQSWLADFLKHRFEDFGDFEDAIEPGQSWLWHSVLTPMLNIGLLTPGEVVAAAVSFAEANDVPMNSIEGFVRQVIGWREFMRATYEDLGVSMRTTNHWSHHRKIPSSFWDATTGIEPIDDTIRRVLDTGYCHHIERLMVLGGFMFLCEFDPDEIYRWFMEMFVDSYDWVMVPNVYAMSQNADGGQITTKPYFSGSSYIRKMSHYARGDWCEVWDGLYWRWILNHADDLQKNPRWAMMCSAARKMDTAKRDTHLSNANRFLASL